MNELRGKYVNVVLGVEEGKGMDFLKHPVYIVAHFNGRVMESDCVEPHPSPDFNTELVWETEKKIIRKVRSTNSPLRVECFNIDEYGKKECIGFTLLSLRSANIIPANRPELQIPIKWHKLIGVPAQYKKSHPELYLSLSLRDHCINNSMPPAIPKLDNLEVSESTEKTIIPVKYMEGGYIQIGDDHCNEKFELKIVIKLASNLDVLLPKTLVFAPNLDKFCMVFNLFGISINTKPFYRDLHETIILNEHIVVKLQSTFDIIKMFFGQFNEVLVYFHHGASRLAFAKINMEKLIPEAVEFVEFKETYKGKISRRISIEETCIFDFETFQSNSNEISGDRKPFIQVDTQISCENEKTVKISEKEIVETDSNETIESLQSISKEVIKHMDGCGDRFKKVLSPITECLVESPRQQIELPLMNLTHSENGDYQKFSLDIIIESLVWRKYTTSKNFIFKFKHPKASSVLAIRTEMENYINRNILLESVHCKLIYVTTSENIWHILQTWKPALIIEDKTGTKICKKHHFKTEELKSQREYSYVSSQMDAKDILVDLKIWMCLQTIDFAEIPKINYLLEPHILDDFLTLKELNELETWKKEVKDKFIEELKVKEKEQLDDLMKSWTERKNSLENKLISNVNRCKILSKELQRNSSTLKVQKALQEKEQTTALDKIHDEVRKNAIKYSLNGNYELLERISDVERENANLKEMLVDLNEELNSMKKSSLSNQQTATLLQEVRCLEEKYMEAQKVKGYFKEQYAKAVKEIHQLKTEGQKTIQNQLQVKKEELSQLSLDKFFEMHHSDGSFNLNGDMLKPNVIRKKSRYPFRNAAEDEDEQVIMETIDYMNTL
ncbi:hypothetical protein MML48_8g00021629 [Holotrichia oblita]|uniref:Uncharacterized protein n=2 Tax=Holotrichia oblita TaxID=644536 RepID=A0ACB9SPI4_HOLOL|nr:hypothetical protein MML48_8g00007634 [Holotrichia oblita]KAI4457028.1 hypothetical protein MML48_8g00021629 [Holotrichia oblita]